MSDITVRALGEDDWEQYRSVRLSALEESPEAFVATADEERAYEEDFWRNRMRRRQRLLAERDGAPVGVASVGQAAGTASRTTRRSPSSSASGSPPPRGAPGSPPQLVQAGADAAARAGRSHLAYWVGADNGRAVAFASGFGFRPTDSRRPMRVKGSDDDEEEVAMVLPLGEDRGVPSL